jgi:hypothetical protein
MEHQLMPDAMLSEKSIIRVEIILPLVFVSIALLLFLSNAFPSLYGDEYRSLFDGDHLSGNIHVIGCFLQLRLWNSILQQDWFLRSISIIQLGREPVFCCSVKMEL